MHKYFSNAQINKDKHYLNIYNELHCYLILLFKMSVEMVNISLMTFSL